MNPAIDFITVEGFLSFSSLTLELRPLNVLIGANGSGKSNLLRAFSFLRVLREGRLQEYVGQRGGAERLLHFGSKTSARMKLAISFEGKRNQYSIEIEATDQDELIPASEEVSFWDGNHPKPFDSSLARRGKEAGISDPGLQRTGHYIRDHLDRFRSYHFHDTSASSAMKKTADLNDNRFLRADGANLAAFLYHLREEHPGPYQLIRESVRRVAPFFLDFALEPLALNKAKIRLEWAHKGTDRYFDASSLSDGTLRFMALATLLLQPVDLRPSVILLDEPELGLHPSAIGQLAALLKMASVETQVLVATQSSLLLDEFGPEDVLVAERQGGSTRIERLDPAPLEQWLEEYSLGQLWEKNEFGGRPQGE